VFDLSLTDTIIAVSTPPGQGGIGVVRLSGPKALAVARGFFRPKAVRTRIEPGRVVLGDLFGPDDGTPFDEAFLVYFKAPRSYTREDVIELSGHGSPAILEETVRLGCRFGARLAHPGEFTLRAHIHGRLDILQAAAVDDLIKAGSFEQARLAFRNLEGRLSHRIDGLRAEAVELAALVEAAIEFPDEGLAITPGRLASRAARMAETVEALVRSYDAGRALSRGVTVAILGRPNVGKSTLFNALLEEPRAIVTRHPGTTRDYIRESFRLEGRLFHFVDTAGFGRPSSAIEKEGIRRGEAIASRADGLLILLDASRRETAEDRALVEKHRGRKAILVLNKIDRSVRIRPEEIRDRYPDLPVLGVSALKGNGLDVLKGEISKVFAPRVDAGDEIVFHLREKLLLEEALVHLRRAAGSIAAGHSEEIFAEEVRRVVPIIGELTGEVRTDEVLEGIFSKFCVGK
jgi:tRNA modification GTPase